MNPASNLDKRDSATTRTRRSARVAGDAARAKRAARRSVPRSRGAALACEHSADTDSTSEAPFGSLSSDVLNPDDEIRRVELLRRLNQITQKKEKLAKRIPSPSPPPRDAPPSTARAATSSTSRERRSRFADAKDIPPRARPRAPNKRSAPSVEPMVVDEPPPSRTTSDAALSVLNRAANDLQKQSLGKHDLMMVDRKRSGAPVSPASSVSPAALPRARTSAVLLASGTMSTANLVKNQQVSYCLRLVKDMLRLKDAFGFSKPIDRLWSRDQLPGYFEMITQPMDLGTIKHRLEAGSYLIPTPGGGSNDASFDSESFSNHMRLVFNNARTYNRPGDIFYEAATRLLEKFETRFGQMPTKLDPSANQSKSKSKKRKKASFSTSDKKKSTDSARRKKPATAKKKAGNAGGASSASATNETNGSGSAASKEAVGNIARKSTPKPKKNARAKASANDSSPSKAKKALPKLSRKDIDDMTTEEINIRMRRIEVRLNLPTATASVLYTAQARALYDEEMSYDEKVQLSMNVNDLPPEKIAKLLKLASKDKNSSIEVSNNEVVELDIDGMDNKTLRDMEALVLQTLGSRRGAGITPPPNGDIPRMPREELKEEMERLREVYSKRKKTPVNSRSAASPNSEVNRGTGKKSLYESDSSSDSDDSSGSSDDDSSSDEDSDSDSSADDESPETMRKRRERNLAHQQAMQAAGTPLQSPGYS